MPKIISALTATVLLFSACATGPQIVDTNHQAIRDYAKAYVNLAAFDGVILVAEGENIVFHEAFGLADYRSGAPLKVDARFRVASLSKQVTQAAIGKLVDRGLMRLDDVLARHLPEFPNADRITILQLLDNTSGIKHTNTLDWLDMKKPYELEDIVNGLAGEELDFDPGTDRSYSNGGYAVAAAVIEKVSGKDFAPFIHDEFARQGYPSLGHETAYQVVPQMAYRYMPGPEYGERVEAVEYITANRIGGGSIYANAEDVYRLFRSTFRGDSMSADTYTALFEMPKDGDTLITGRAAGTLAQIYYNIVDDLTVVTLSSNSAWPGSLNKDVLALYRGEDVPLRPIAASNAVLSADELLGAAGGYTPERFRWNVRIAPHGDGLIWLQDEMRVAFEKTDSGEFHLPVWDWLCRFDEMYSEMTCRQRDPSSDAAFRFIKQ